MPASTRPARSRRKSRRSGRPTTPKAPRSGHIDLPKSVLIGARAKAKRIVRILGLPADHVDDIAGDFHVRLARALTRFDPTKGTVQAFSNAVLTTQYMAIFKRFRAQAKKHQCIPMSDLPDLIEAPVAPAARLRDGWTRAEVRAALKTLPPDDQILARLVADLSIRAVAKVVGCHHGTVVRRKRRLRRQLRAAILGVREKARTSLQSCGEN